MSLLLMILVLAAIFLVRAGVRRVYGQLGVSWFDLLWFTAWAAFSFANSHPLVGALQMFTAVLSLLDVAASKGSK